jgi:hypothetical protein
VDKSGHPHRRLLLPQRSSFWVEFESSWYRS